jgi:hypothetical protein
MPLAHSAPTLHSGCDTHAGQAPPQSIPASPPFKTPSEQVGDGHCPELQLPQVVSASHAGVSGQVGHTGLPQSSSVPASRAESPQSAPGGCGAAASGEIGPESGKFELGGVGKSRSGGSVKPQRQCSAPDRHSSASAGNRRDGLATVRRLRRTCARILVTTDHDRHGVTGLE